MLGVLKHSLALRLVVSRVILILHWNVKRLLKGTGVYLALRSIHGIIRVLRSLIGVRLDKLHKEFDRGLRAISLLIIGVIEVLHEQEVLGFIHDHVASFRLKDRSHHRDLLGWVALSELLFEVFHHFLSQEGESRVWFGHYEGPELAWV